MPTTANSPDPTPEDLSDFPVGARVRVHPWSRLTVARGRLGTISTCPSEDAWGGARMARVFPVVVDLDPWRPGDAVDADYHFGPDELEVIA